MPREGVQDNSPLGVMQQIREHDEGLLLAAEAFTLAFMRSTWQRSEKAC